MVKNSEAKKQRRSSVSDIRLSDRTGGGRSSSGTGAGTAPPRQQRRSSVSDIRLSGRSGGGRSSPSTGAGIVPPRQQQHLEFLHRQERRRSVGILRNRKTRRSSLATVDILNSLMNDSVSRDLVVGEGAGFATSTHYPMDVDSGGRDGEGGGQLNLDGGEASGGGEGNLEYLYGVLNAVDSSQNESDKQRMEPKSRNAGNGRQLKRSSSLTTLGDLRRRSSLVGPSDLFGESMLLNDSFVFKLQGSETSFQATIKENGRAQATGPMEGGTGTDKSSSRRSSLEGGRRSKSCGDHMVPLAVETQPLRKKKSRGSPPLSVLTMTRVSFRMPSAS